MHTEVKRDVLLQRRPTTLEALRQAADVADASTRSTMERGGSDETSMSAQLADMKTLIAGMQHRRAHGNKPRDRRSAACQPRRQHPPTTTTTPRQPTCVTTTPDAQLRITSDERRRAHADPRIRRQPDRRHSTADAAEAPQAGADARTRRTTAVERPRRPRQRRNHSRRRLPNRLNKLVSSTVVGSTTPVIVRRCTLFALIVLLPDTFPDLVRTVNTPPTTNRGAGPWTSSKGKVR